MKSYLTSKLNTEQCNAALHTQTSSLILAGAGSGKTRTLTYKIAYLMVALGVSPSHILAVTFTNKAANEMKERIHTIIQELPDEVLGLQQRPKTQQLHRVGTFHSIFLRVLKQDIEHLDRGYTKNFAIYDSNETLNMIKKICKDLHIENDVDAREAKGFISKCKNEGFDYTGFTKGIENDYQKTMAMIYKEYDKQLKLANCLDFDDLLLLPYLLLKKSPDLCQKRQKQFQYILVDEAQDTNHIQFQLMQFLSGKNDNITFIGDDFQSIYGWRGAIMENFLNLKKFRPNLEIFKLETNYRSRPHIVRAGAMLIKKNSFQYEKNLTAHRTGDDTITIFSHGDDAQEAINIIDFLTKLKTKKNKSRSDFAILYRTNAQSSPFERILIQQGIPYKIFGSYKFFERKEIKDIIAYCKFLANPKDDVALLRIINTPSRKIGATSMDGLSHYAQLANLCLFDTIMGMEQFPIDIGAGAKKAIYGFGQLVHTRQQMIQSQDATPASLIKSIIKEIDYKTYLIKDSGQEAGEEKYENIGQLINMAEKYDDMGDHDKNISGLDMLRGFLEEVTLMTDVALEDKENSDSIKLMTIHASKGLEFPYVSIVGCEENIFPLANAKLDTKQLEEERRLMYVALTRAQDHVFLSRAKSRMQWGRSQQNPVSRFLSEIPQDLVKTYDLDGGNTNNGSKYQGDEFIVGDRVKHPLFGEGNIIEVRNRVCIVRFANPKFGIRKIESRLLKQA